MSLREHDLKGVVLPKISVDEFEPKTGEKEEVSVIGLFVSEESAGEDLANFINKGSLEYRDVEVSPNPTEDNEYMVFVEFDRNGTLLNTLFELVEDITHLSGELDWKVKPLLSEDPVPLDLTVLTNIVAQDPTAYKTKEEYEEHLETERTNSIQNFILDNANVSDVVLNDNVLEIKDYKYNIKLEFINFGEGKVTLEESGLSELAIDSGFDHTLMKRLESMRGNLSIVPINKHIVFHNPASDQVLVARPC